MATIFQKTISNAFHAKEILYLCLMKFATVKPIRHLFGAKPLYEPINSPPSSAAYMRQWTGSALVQIMACRLFGAKPISEPMLGYCQFDF